MSTGGEPHADNVDQVAPTGNNRRGALKKRAYEELRTLILTEEYPPGTFLSERKLSQRLEMSKTPIRAALEIMEAEGFVMVSPQQGIVVRDIPFNEIVDVFDIRVALEAFVVRQLAGTVTSEQEQRIERNLKAQADSAREGDVTNGTKLDADFHLLLCEILDNREIVRVMWGLRDKLYRVILRVMRQDPSRLSTSLHEHTAIAEAMVQGNVEDAVEKITEHLEYGKRFLIS